MLKGLFVLGPENYDRIYSSADQQAIAEMVDLVGPVQSAAAVAEAPAILRDVEVVFSGWGGPYLDAAFLDAAPNLKLFLYGAGSIRRTVTDTFWERGIRISSAAAANAIPVSEFTLAQILFSLKHGWHYALTMQRTGQWLRKQETMPGAYGATVGLISLGLIGRRVADLLRQFDVNVIAYDPFVSAETAAELGVKLVSLDAVFAQADVVSLHTPWLDETVGMITGAHFAALKPGATFINTARGAIVREDEMIAVLQQRPDVYALLDVTWPEPPAPDSPLLTLPNVVLTPHIAGALGPECWRMGHTMVDELRRYIEGEPLRYEVTREQFARMA